MTGDILSSFDYSIYIFTLYIICNSISSINTVILLICIFFQLRNPSFSSNVFKGGVTSIIKVYADVRLEWVYFSGLRVYEWGIIFASKVYQWGIFFTQKVYQWVKYMNGYNKIILDINVYELVCFLTSPSI